LTESLTVLTGIFQKLLPYALPNNLRLIPVNLRDYQGSSKYTAEELEAVSSKDPDRQAAFLKDQGRQLAGLLESLAETLNVPPIREMDGKKVGGMALLTWSMSNCMNVAFLANASTFPERTIDFLGKYLRKSIFLGKCPLNLIINSKVY
jgi:hypothetical protein